jgi:hypothetical protein
VLTPQSLLSDAHGLVEKDGIWYSTRTVPVSFPGEGYDNCFNLEDRSLWFRHRNRCIIQVVKKYSPTGSAFVDLGGGNGYVAAALQEAGFDTCLVEAGVKGALNARSRGIRNIICSSIKEVMFRKDNIPAIGLFDVLEHIEHDKQVLEILRELLTSDGLMYITVPAYQFLWSPEDTYSGHFRRYSISSLKKVLSDSGYSNLYGSYFFSCLPLPIFFLRTLPGRVRIRPAMNHVLEKRLSSFHSTRLKIVEKTWEVFSRWEVGMLGKQKRIPFGSSCLIVAKKK